MLAALLSWGECASAGENSLQRHAHMRLRSLEGFQGYSVGRACHHWAAPHVQGHQNMMLRRCHRGRLRGTGRLGTTWGTISCRRSATPSGSS